MVGLRPQASTTQRNKFWTWKFFSNIRTWPELLGPIRAAAGFFWTDLYPDKDDLCVDRACRFVLGHLISTRPCYVIVYRPLEVNKPACHLVLALDNSVARDHRFSGLQRDPSWSLFQLDRFEDGGRRDLSGVQQHQWKSWVRGSHRCKSFTLYCVGIRIIILKNIFNVTFPFPDWLNPICYILKWPKNSISWPSFLLQRPENNLNLF